MIFTKNFYEEFIKDCQFIGTDNSAGLKQIEMKNLTASK